MASFRQLSLLIPLVGVLAAAPACSGGSTTPQNAPDLASLLTSAVPAGYTTPSGGAAALDVASAAPATLADPGKMRLFLVGNDYRTGYVHVYTSAAGYIDLLVFQFSNSPQSQGLVRFEVVQLRQALGADVQAEPRIPGAYVFTLFAKTRAQPRPVFCQGVWYAVEAYAFEVSTCGSAPADPSLALSLASLQYAQDRQALGVPPAAS